MNLLQETLDELKDHKLSPDDVLWVGSRDGRFKSTWKTFEKLANRDYDPEYGSNEVSLRLVIVGKDWWLERGEYDGSEWWSLKQLPKPQKKSQSLRNIFMISWHDPLGE